MCQCVVKRACISGVKGLEVDLEVTSSITWTGPGDRKQLQQSWRCLQEIYWHGGSETFSTLRSLYHTQASSHTCAETEHTSMHAYTLGHKWEWKKTCACTITTHRHTLRRQQSGVSWRDTDTLAFQQPGSLDRSGPHTSKFAALCSFQLFSSPCFWLAGLSHQSLIKHPSSAKCWINLGHF